MISSHYSLVSSCVCYMPYQSLHSKVYKGGGTQTWERT